MPNFGMPIVVDLIAHAELVEQLDIARQQRFADVKARMMVLLEQDHAAPLPREQRRDGRAGRTAADDQDVAIVNSLHCRGTTWRGAR